MTESVKVLLDSSSFGEEDLDTIVKSSILYVVNQFIVALNDGNLDYGELEQLGKKLYRLRSILTIYKDKKGRAGLTKDEFVGALTSIITEMKETIK